MKTWTRTISYALPYALAASCVFAQSTAWSHDPSAAIGPFHWGGITTPYETCGTAPSGSSTVAPVGMAQTPINIQTASTVLAILPGIQFHYADTQFEVENTGHVVEVVYDAGSSIRLGKSLTDIYQLLQFHFHAPSEHTINGVQYDAELHLVHQNLLGQLVVVGVLVSASSTAGVTPFDQIVMTAPLLPGTATMNGMTLNASSLLPQDQDYFTYTGSLTTPPCTEGVRWFLMQTPVSVSPSVIAQLHLITSQFPGYNGFENNSRPVTPLNGRTVLQGY